MKVKAKTIRTPVGLYPAPLDPHFAKQIEPFETNEQLFEIVETNGFICPDAYNEVKARGLVGEYSDWVLAKRQANLRENFSKRMDEFEKSFFKSTNFNIIN